jgi:microcystin-dependent protein
MQQTIDTLAELKAIRFSVFDEIFCKETSREYFFKQDGGLTPDDLEIVTTAQGGNWRLVAKTGKGGGADGAGTIASQAEAEAGTENTKAMSALRTAQAIAAQVVSPVSSVHGRTGAVTAQAGDYAAYYDKWPVGSKIEHFGATAPTGFLACDGAAISRATYAALFAVISTTYGVGNGSTTFNLPDARGLVSVGAGAHGSMTRADGSAYNGGSVGASRNDQMQGHLHAVNPIPASYNASIGAGSNSWSGTTSINTGAPITDGTNGTPRTGNETRPAEIAVLVCIKY